MISMKSFHPQMGDVIWDTVSTKNAPVPEEALLFMIVITIGRRLTFTYAMLVNLIIARHSASVALTRELMNLIGLG